MIYRKSDERHRALEALEKLWDKYPHRRLTSLITELTEDKQTEDDKLVRRINTKLRE